MRCRRRVDKRPGTSRTRPWARPSPDMGCRLRPVVSLTCLHGMFVCIASDRSLRISKAHQARNREPRQSEQVRQNVIKRCGRSAHWLQSPPRKRLRSLAQRLLLILSRMQRLYGQRLWHVHPHHSRKSGAPAFTRLFPELVFPAENGANRGGKISCR